MKKLFPMIRFLTVLVLISCLLLVGCSRVDERIVASVGDREITMQQYENAFANSEAYAYFYYGFDLATEEGLAAYQDLILDSLLENAMLLYQAEELGIVLTDAETANANEQGKADYDEFYQTFLDSAESAGATDVRAYANQLLTDTLVANGLTVSSAKKSFIDNAIDSALLSKVNTYMNEQVSLTENDLMAMYADELEEQKALFDEDAAQYFTYELNYMYGAGCKPIYTPEGFIRVKHILVEDEATANTVLSKVEAGEDFEALLAEYNTDPGMTNEETAEGYLVGEGANYVEEFLTAALALEKDGDVSPVVQSQHGYHIIKRVATVPSSVLLYEDDKEAFDSYFTTKAKNDYYFETMSAWMETEGLVTVDEDLKTSVGK